MTTNEIKKGMRVQLRNGWYATIEDNKKGNIRMATVEGIVTEMGSVYAHDIVAVWNPAMFEGKGGWTTVLHTEQQLRSRKLVNSLF